MVVDGGAPARTVPNVESKYGPWIQVQGRNSRRNQGRNRSFDSDNHKDGKSRNSRDLGNQGKKLTSLESNKDKDPISQGNRFANLVCEENMPTNGVNNADANMVHNPVNDVAMTINVDNAEDSMVDNPANDVIMVNNVKNPLFERQAEKLNT